MQYCLFFCKGEESSYVSASLELLPGGVYECKDDIMIKVLRGSDWDVYLIRESERAPDEMELKFEGEHGSWQGINGSGGSDIFVGYLNKLDQHPKPHGKTMEYFKQGRQQNHITMTKIFPNTLLQDNFAITQFSVIYIWTYIYSYLHHPLFKEINYMLHVLDFTKHLLVYSGNYSKWSVNLNH